MTLLFSLIAIVLVGSVPWLYLEKESLGKRSLEESIILILSSGWLITVLYPVCAFIIEVSLDYAQSLCALAIVRFVLGFSSPPPQIHAQATFSSHKPFDFKRYSVLPLVSSALFIGFFGYVQLGHTFIHGDAVGIWFSKTQVFTQQQSASISYFNQASFTSQPDDPSSLGFNITRPEYPLFLPITLAYPNLINGVFDVRLTKIFWFLILPFHLYVLYSAMKLYLSRPLRDLSFLGYLLIPSFYAFFTFDFFGYADIWLATVYLIMFYWISQDFKRKQSQYLVPLTGITLAALSLKLEGFIALWLLGVYYVNCQKFVSNRRLGLVTLILIISVFLLQYPLKTFGTGQNYFTALVSERFDIRKLTLVPTLVFKLIQNLYNPRHHVLLWYLYAFAFVPLILGRRWLRFCLHLAPLLGFCFFLLLYAIAPQDPFIFLQSSVNRYASQWLPFAYVSALSILVPQIFTNSNQNQSSKSLKSLQQN